MMQEQFELLRSKFYSLEKRDQRMLLVAVVALFFYVLMDVIFLGAYDARERNKKRFEANSATLSWMTQAVAEIQQLKGSGAISSGSANRTLSQIAESSAKRANFRMTRFQPKGDSEAQVWLDKIPFNSLLAFINHLEMTFSVSIETLAVNSTGEPGLVNARIKFKK